MNKVKANADKKSENKKSENKKSFTISTYRTFERSHKQEIALQKSTAFDLTSALRLDNQSQLIDFVKHSLIDSELSKSQKVNLTLISAKINEIVNQHEELKNKFFNHSKYEKENAVQDRIKKHLSCDKRHSETRFAKRQISINSKVIATVNVE